ncbi:MAG: chromosomal replication initiator protein DnaA [Candidatus Auribacterota bacterium]|nr:chromosomal replication initiator protein DnaA [Candidatus Auribacterota bacterium]
MDTPEFWNNVLDRIKENISDFSYNSWFQCIQQVRKDGSSVHIELPNNLARNWMLENFSGIIKEALFLELGEELSVHFDVSEPTPVEEPKRGQKSAKSAPSTFKISRSSLESQSPVLNNNYTFDTFVVGASNRFAHAAAVAVGRSPAKAYNPLFIYGGVGLGKTHLMQAIGNKIIDDNPDFRVHYLSSEIFTNKLIDAIQNRNTVKFRKKYRNVDVLLIDDIQFLSGKEQTQEEFFHTFNTLYDAHKQIVITSDRAPKDIEYLEDRLISRFEWGLVTDLQPPDIETRIAILRKKVESSNADISEDVIYFLANKIKSNIRKLEGALIRISSYASLTKSKITIPMVQDVLHDTLEDDLSRVITVDQIHRLIAEEYDLRIQDLIGPKRTKNIVLPRQVAMFITRRITPLSLPEIGKAFGGRDHTTVLHAINNIEAKIKERATFRATIDAHIDKLRSNKYI